MYCKTVGNIRRHPWWSFVNKYPHLAKKVGSVMALLTGSQPVNMQRNLGRLKCGICEAYEVDNATHVLFNCESLEETRSTAWASVIREMRTGMLHSIESMSACDATKCVISCFHVTYISEWDDLYKHIASFVYSMYSARAQCYDSTNSNTVGVP